MRLPPTDNSYKGLRFPEFLRSLRRFYCGTISLLQEQHQDLLVLPLLFCLLQTLRRLNRARRAVANKKVAAVVIVIGCSQRTPNIAERGPP